MFGVFFFFLSLRPYCKEVSGHIDNSIELESLAHMVKNVITKPVPWPG